MNPSSYADPQLCYLDLVPTSPNENTIIQGGIVAQNITDEYVFETVDALLAHLAEDHPRPVGRLIVEWTNGREEHQRTPNRLTSRRIVGRTAMVNGKLEVKS